MINRILHSCSFITEFIKLVGKTDKMLGKASHLIFFPNSFNKFNNVTHVRFSILTYTKSTSDRISANYQESDTKRFTNAGLMFYL